MREYPFQLDARLKALADFVRPGAKVADVGTDHAYLPVWLVRKGVATSAVAVDINKKPLQKAVETANKYRAGELVEPRLSDGLDAVAPHEADDVIIAGMGGEQICRIIDRAKWLLCAQKRLILQPMTMAHKLREYLYQNGIGILRENIVAVSGKLYTVMLCEYDGNPVNPTLAQVCIGESAGGGSVAGQYLAWQKRKLLVEADGLRTGKIRPQRERDCREAAAVIQKIIDCREEAK